MSILQLILSVLRLVELGLGYLSRRQVLSEAEQVVLAKQLRRLQEMGVVSDAVRDEVDKLTPTQLAERLHDDFRD